MSKINPGSNVYEDNDLKPMSGMLNGDVPEPRMLKKGKFQCPVCHETFSSKEHYIHHAMIHHSIAFETKESFATRFCTV